MWPDTRCTRFDASDALCDHLNQGRGTVRELPHVQRETSLDKVIQLRGATNIERSTILKTLLKHPRRHFRQASLKAATSSSDCGKSWPISIRNVFKVCTRIVQMDGWTCPILVQNSRFLKMFLLGIGQVFLQPLYQKSSADSCMLH